MIGFFVILTACLLSRMDISIRHFMLPIALLILMLAPQPRMLNALSSSPAWQALTVALVLSCFVPEFLAYPNFFPFVNSLAFGHPTYQLLNDSNVSWNERLPDVESFVQQHHLTAIDIDWASLSDPTLVVPQAQIWDCQAPADRDAGQWVAVSAVNILENHNCAYLQQYPHETLGGGSFYIFKLPSPIPPAGSPGGPPAPAERRSMWGLPVDLRAWAMNVERHPERLAVELDALNQTFQQQSRK
jgi:hypothetical protein